MSEDLEHLRHTPVWSNPLTDEPVMVDNPQVPAAHDYAVLFRAAPTVE